VSGCVKVTQSRPVLSLSSTMAFIAPLPTATRSYVLDAGFPVAAS
jgi:hypothetical protein